MGTRTAGRIEAAEKVDRAKRRMVVAMESIGAVPGLLSSITLVGNCRERHKRFKPIPSDGANGTKLVLIDRGTKDCSYTG